MKPYSDNHCTTASQINVFPLKLNVYLILEVKAMFTDPTSVTNESKVLKESTLLIVFSSSFSSLANSTSNLLLLTYEYLFIKPFF